MLRIGHLTNGYLFWEKVQDRRKNFQYCVNPNYSQKFMYLRAIQGHSGSTINPALQDNVLLPEGFTENIYHVGNGKQMRSTVNHGLIPGRISVKTDKDAVFFNVVNHMDTQNGLGKNPMRFIAPYTNIWKHYQDTFFWCCWKLAQQRGLQFKQTRSTPALLAGTIQPTRSRCARFC